jgi:hypothetical protein
MEQSSVINLVLNDLEDRDIIKSDSVNIVRDYLIQVFAAGCDYERTSSKARRKVAKLDNSGNVLDEYESSSDAGKKNRVRGRNIAKACRGEQIKAYGYYWKYLNE